MEEEITRVENASHEDSAKAGTMLGNYRLGEPVGQGLLGVVHVGLNAIANKRCAVKVFRRDLPGGSVSRGRYIHETETVAHIGHSNIAETYASGFADGRLYTTMEWFEGVPLSRLIHEQAPLSRRAYFPLLREICAALAAVHAYGIPHGHLHPGQILVSWTGQTYSVKVLDFGTHHLLPPLRDQVAGWSWRPEHAICIAPEQIKSPAELDTRTDVYAVSVLLYEMVTGRVPFLADSFLATLDQITGDAPPPPSRILSVPAGLEETILRGLEKDPRRRIPSMEALLAALDPTAVTGQQPLLRAKLTSTGRHRVLTADVSQEIPLPDGVAPEPAFELPPSMPSPSPTELAPVKVPRNRWWLFVVLAVVVAACGVTITLLLLSPEPETPRPTRPIPPRPAVKPRTERPPPPRSPRASAPVRRAAPPASAPTPEPRPEPKPPVARPETLASRARTALAGRKLRKVEGIGALEIATSSDKAEVFVNGKFRGRGKLVIMPTVSAGTYRIHLVVDGKKTPHRDVHVRPNQRLTVKF